MHQNKFGKKLSNWHRPLAPWQASHRYRRQRFDRPDQEPREAEVDPLTDEDVEHLLSRCALCGRFQCIEFTPPEPADREDIDCYRLDQILQRIAPTPNIDLRGVRTPTGEKNRLACSAAAPVAFSAGGVSLEERLAEYVGRVTKLSDNAEVIQRRLAAAIQDVGNVEVVNSVAHDLEERRSLWANRICLFSPFWVRTPLSWDRQGGEMGLLRHLFVLYDVPAFLYGGWAADWENLSSKWLIWFILFGQGGSLKRAARLFGWNIQDSVVDHLLAAPAHLQPEEACFFAEVRRLGGSQLDFERLCGDRSYVADFTEPDRAGGWSRFQAETARWLIAHREEITDEECGHILAWATHEYTERERAGRKAFAWKGRRACPVVERSLRYRDELHRPVRDLRWKEHGWNWTLTDATTR